MITIELKLLKSKKQILPAAVLMIALLFLAFIEYWFIAGQKQLEATDLASFVSIRASQSTLAALFFIFWMLQLSIHLINAGYYKMLLLAGWPRHKVFFYSIVQICLYVLSFMLLNFICYSIFSFFRGTNPFQLLFQTDYNALLSQFLYLTATGFIALALAFLRPNPVMALPVLIYWLLEGWLAGFIHRKLESDTELFLPLQAFKQIISENLLNTQQTILIAIYALVALLVLHFSIQKRMFV
ncbi:hypothetical protein [uncultured Draconibacterium sp.]|uniref:hypothetical protein n=1 Tax=uncultured Draconibacterium sp. TaxID=1573823 RepID=UPI002AA92F95|nr:hypothetical protein [uncultured Draconibacterium sp.]